MNKEELTGLLDCIYELEGLVHPALSRDDSPEALPELIARKGEELSQRPVGLPATRPRLWRLPPRLL